MSILFYVQWSSVFNVTNCSVALQHAATESLYVVCITQLVLYMQHCRLHNFVHLHRILQMTVAKDITACHVLIYLKAKSIVLLVLISTVYWLVDFSTVWCQFFPSVLWHCWLGGRKGIRPVKNWVVGCWRGYLSGARCEVQTCIWPSWCHCHSLSLASVKSRLVLPFWYRLTRVVPEKGPLNGCACVCVCVYL